MTVGSMEGKKAMRDEQLQDFFDRLEKDGIGCFQISSSEISTDDGLVIIGFYYDFIFIEGIIGEAADGDDDEIYLCAIERFVERLKKKYPKVNIWIDEYWRIVVDDKFGYDQDIYSRFRCVYDIVLKETGELQ